ncbi:hypothetical protein ACFL34_02245 [Candidatus Sumerlaeota bacterium]
MKNTCKLTMALIVCVGVLSQVDIAGAETEGSESKNQRESKGTVVGTYDNEHLLLRENNAYWVVRFGKEFWEMGIRRGDVIKVSGTLDMNSMFKNEIRAQNIRRLEKVLKPSPPIGIRSIADTLALGRHKDIIAFRGEVKDFESTKMTVTDGRHSIIVELKSMTARDSFAIGDELVVAGVVGMKLPGAVVEPVMIRPVSFFKRPDEPAKPQSIKSVLKAKPMGKMVRVKGRVALFIGAENATILYQEEDILVIERSEKHMSVDVPAGTEVEAVGVFGIKTYKGREYGMLKEARIDSVLRAEEARR